MSQSTHTHPAIFVPQALLVDKRLTPLERNAWLAFRSKAGDNGTAVVSYESLRDYLSIAPGSQKAALETVARAVLCLRLSTWVALVEYRRNSLTGFSMASRYVARDEPLSFDEACRTDDDYLPLLERALGHSSATVRQLARGVLKAALRNPDALGRLPVAMQEWIGLLQKRYYGDSWGDSEDPPPCNSSPSSACPQSTDIDIPKHAPEIPVAVRTKENISVHTYSTDAQPQSEVPKPTLGALDRFHRLPPDQQRYLTARLERLRPEQRQSVLDEWDVRCSGGYVRNAIAYLYGLVRKALEGAFCLWAARKAAPDPGSAKTLVKAPCLHQSPIRLQFTLPTPRPASREVARRALDAIRKTLEMPKRASQVLDEMACNGLLSKPSVALPG